MFYIVMIALLLLSARVAVAHKKNILDVIALFTAGLIMILYVLAFFGAMKGIWIVAAVAVCYVLVRAFTDSRHRSKNDSGSSLAELLRYVKTLFTPGLITFVLAITAVGFATSDMMFTWWDDINFWSSDAKQLFFLNGFPGKYGNVSPEFGDYPPVTSIFKWLFLQIRGKEYTESLQFLGYFALNGIFLLPLLGRIREYIDDSGAGKAASILFSVLGTVLVLFLPGVFNGIIYYGTPADVTMAIVYGALLLAIYDQYGHGRIFYFGRIGLYASVLLLTKSIGFEWTLFALIFYVFMGKRDKAIWGSIAAAAASFGSWMGLCLINRRIAKLTGAGVRMATSGSYRAPANTSEKLRYFLEGFAFEPMHSDHNITIDLSAAAAVVLIFATVFLLYNMKLLGKSEVKKTALFTLITGLAAYGIVFLAHISIFQGEDQYLDSYAMGISIARYCAPFTLGTTYLLMGIMFNRLRARGGKKFGRMAALAALVFVFLTADYSGVYKYLVGFKASLADDRAYYEDMVGDEGRKIGSALDDPSYWGRRVLVLRDGHEYYWVHNAYINKETSPVALVYDGYLTEEDTAESVMEKIRSSHADYIYIEDETGESRELFSRVIKNGDFEPGVVYSLAEDVY